MEKLPSDTIKISEVPGLAALIIDVIRILEVRISIDVPHEQIGSPGIIVHEGPGLYSLLDSGWHPGSTWIPAVRWIGQSSHVKARVRTWERTMEDQIIFDGARAVFIESYAMRCLLEKQLIKWFRNPDNGHSDSLQNQRC
jgi:hypothetical protein